MVRIVILSFTFLLLLKAEVNASPGHGFTKPIVEAAKQLENSLVQQKIEFVEPYLSENFILNNFEPSLSKKLFKSIIPVLEVKKLDSIKIDDIKSDTVFISTILDANKGYFKVQICMLQKEESSSILSIQFGMKLNVTLFSNGFNEESKVVNKLSDFHLIKQDDVYTYYEKGILELAGKVARIQYDGINQIQAMLGEELAFPLGVVLVSGEHSNMVITQPVIPVTITNENTLDSLGNLLVNWIYFHELTELHMVYGKGVKDQNTRWFRDGLAEYLAYKVCCIQDPVLANSILKERKTIYRASSSKADLLNWIGTGKLQEKRVLKQNDTARYGAALVFFNELFKEYGDGILPQILSDLKEGEVTSDSLLSALSKATGEDIKARIINY